MHLPSEYPKKSARLPRTSNDHKISRDCAQISYSSVTEKASMDFHYDIITEHYVVR